MQFVWLMLNKQFKFSRRHCDFCVNSEHFHQDCFSCKLLGRHMSLPLVFRDTISLSFLIYGAERWYLLHFFPSIFLKKEDTMQRDQHILTFLLCFYAKISHVRENSLLARFPFSPPASHWDFPSNHFMNKPVVFPAVGEFTKQMGVLPLGPQNVWRLMVTGQIPLPAQKRAQ